VLPATLWLHLHLIAAPAWLALCCCVLCLQHIQVKHLLKILSVSQLSQPSRILFGEWQVA
jgi:hypothetical protein